MTPPWTHVALPLGIVMVMVVIMVVVVMMVVVMVMVVMVVVVMVMVWVQDLKENLVPRGAALSLHSGSLVHTPLPQPQCP